MRKLWRAVGIFWAIAGTGVGIVGGYMAAVEAKAEAAFWVVIALAAVGAFVFWIGPLLVKIVRKLQTHDSLVGRVATLEAELSESQQQLIEAVSAAKTALLQGVTEGEGRVIGMIRANRSPPPRLTGIAVIKDQVVLVGVANEVAAVVGARYLLRSTNTQQVWGVVELQDWDGEGRATLRCVEATVPKFWDALAKRVLESDAPPRDVDLEPFRLAYDPNPQLSEASIATDIQSRTLEEQNG